ncbi:MAG TPA: ribosome maturation factor RimP [Gammaproteobacteria bacterium]|nr:ribosome maturation factor RimP [Gammaproteobacteria bacterium]MEC8009242.1 ribosome maturation factor RimP [Pseudomonadota bacterium]HBF08319.1 ribosome maturation factor RimP [Gammaproteobacteria bacterium]HCK91932.1 ribosome maturation factor RimP [Gammaproteobacteria bacterium]|tara:strand:- start:441 stop:887 length:447 start_codon:yes stop_codon:yes gene_type:complete
MHSKIESLIEPLVQDMGYMYWGLELILGGNKPTLRVFVDTEKGINVDECGEISREVGAALDVANIPEGEYTLEVSSPGLDRILFNLKQCQMVLGSEVTVALISAIDGRRRYKGNLLEVDGDAVIIGDEGAQLRIPFHKVKRMRVVPQF